MKIPLKYKLFLFAFLICYIPLSGQQVGSDTLNSVIADTSRINQLNVLAWEIMFNNPDTAIALGNQALSMSEKLQWKKGIASSLRNLGVCYYLISDGSKALEYYFRALKIMEVTGDKNSMAKILNNIGLVYFDQGEYPKALDYYIKTLKIDDELGDKSGMSATFGNIGNIYEKQLNYPKAVEYYTKSLNIGLELGDKNITASQFSSIGTIYHNQNDLPKALEYYVKAVSISREIRNLNLLGKCLGNIGIVYYEQNQNTKALEYAKEALKIGEKLGDQSLIATELAAIGDIYLETKKYALAEKYYTKSLKISHEIEATELSMKLEGYLASVYEKTGKYQKALLHTLNAIVLKDTIFNQEKNKEITRKELNYEFDKKEAVTKAEQDKKDILSIAELKQKEQQRNYFIIGFAMLALFMVFVYRAYRQKQRDNVIITQQKIEVESQKLIIEEKNKGIVDSINYAKRIQQAKLPNKEDIYEALPESFVLFKPKDIVSGDFYFFYKKEQTIFIVAADCTGHGVPGALMSMIGSEQLKDAVLQSSDTSVILKRLNIGMKLSLRQSGSEESTRDGMDIAICSIDTTNLIVKYAGANRPLWYVRKGETVLEEVDPTNKAIGGLTDNDQEFQSHEIQFSKGDTFYICTDGYADQFGGQKGKKLMTRKFKEIIQEIQHLSMSEQEKHLENFNENWKSAIEQVDDILVIGVRV